MLCIIVLRQSCSVFRLLTETLAAHGDFHKTIVLNFKKKNLKF